MSAAVRFGEFEWDSGARELRKRGLLLSIPEQSLQVLELLIERPAQVVTREEIRQRLWPDGTFVEYEHSMSSAVNRLRTALRDTAAAPRFVETLPRRGYRFVATVEVVASAHAEPEPPVAGVRPPRPVRSRTIALVLVVLAASAAGWGLWRTTGGRPAYRSIAVLPLVSLSSDTEQEYLADGITEELITSLAQIRALQVVSRTSAMRYKGTKKSIPEIRRELSVDAVVEGTVQRSNGRVRVTAQLIDTATDRHLWSRSYDLDVGEVLALRDQISSAISEELRVRANPADRERIRGKRLVNPEAYEAWLKGRYFAARYHRTGQQKAVEHFEEAVRLDPGYALAWAGLAHAIGYLEYWDDEPVSDRLRSAMRRAMELDPNLAEAHINYADVKFYGEWDWKSGEAAFRRAVELDPASVDARDHYAICLAALGRNEPALQETERALRLDPLSPGLTTDAGKRWLGLGRPDRAIAMLKRAIDLDSQYGPAWLALASAYEAAAKPKEAMTALMKSRNFDGAGNTSVDSLGAAYETGGMKAMRLQIARERLQAVERRAAAGRVSPRLRAEAYAAVGAREEAFRWLEEAYRQRCPTMTWLKTGQQWDPLRVDPRFQSLLHRMKLD